MAKRQTKVPRARKTDARARDDDSVLVRSAESLGRVIGSLQRQLQRRSTRAASTGHDASAARPEPPRIDEPSGGVGHARGGPAAVRKPRARQTKPAGKPVLARKSPAGKTSHARKASGSRRRT
ncbi:MAG: hypothetical protein ACRD26_15225 [Vicinamibacterales bacterium]